MKAMNKLSQSVKSIGKRNFVQAEAEGDSGLPVLADYDEYEDAMEDGTENDLAMEDEGEGIAQEMSEASTEGMVQMASGGSSFPGRRRRRRKMKKHFKKNKKKKVSNTSTKKKLSNGGSGTSSGGTTDPETKAEKKFNRRFNRYMEKHADEMKGKQKHEQFDAFRNSKNILGKKRGDTKWFQQYLEETKKSSMTWWDVGAQDAPIIIVIPGEGGEGRTTLTTEQDIRTSKGKITVNYDMRDEADRLVIRSKANPDQIIYDSGTVRNKEGSGRTVDFDLGEGNTEIIIEVNPGKTGSEGSYFDFDITVVPTDPKSGGTIIRHQPKPKKGSAKYKKTTKK